MKRIRDEVSKKVFFVDDLKVDQFFDEYMHPERLVILDGDE